MVFLRVILGLSLLAILPGLILPDGIWRDIAFLAAILAVASGIIVLRGAKGGKPAATPGSRRRKKRRPIVVDGSNVMHWKDQVAQLDVLREVVRVLDAQGYRPGVVFDANAGYKLQGRYLDDRPLAHLLGLPEDQVLVVQKGSPADPVILQTARALGAPIVTNDRYRDWAATYPEVDQPGHLIRGGFQDGRLVLRFSPDAKAA
ncbi:MAG: hypothetical protein WAK98_13420 [Gemmobacter sp.]